ncbi:hypothetical protein N0V85_007062 [Neurospora sp. IMI 360204]|nr:hypothetical protein N0V85_007062 [Neurospora sp. IMI 360204]
MATTILQVKRLRRQPACRRFEREVQILSASPDPGANTTSSCFGAAHDEEDGTLGRSVGTTDSAKDRIGWREEELRDTRGICERNHAGGPALYFAPVQAFKDTATQAQRFRAGSLQAVLFRPSPNPDLHHRGEVGVSRSPIPSASAESTHSGATAYFPQQDVYTSGRKLHSFFCLRFGVQVRYPRFLKKIDHANLLNRQVNSSSRNFSFEDQPEVITLSPDPRRPIQHHVSQTTQEQPSSSQPTPFSYLKGKPRRPGTVRPRPSDAKPASAEPASTVADISKPALRSSSSTSSFHTAKSFWSDMDKSDSKNHDSSSFRPKSPIKPGPGPRT